VVWMRVLHIGNTAGVGSIIAKHMDKLFGTESWIVNRRVFDSYGFTTQGELWDVGPSMFALKSLLKARKFDIVHLHFFDKFVPYLKLLYPKKPVILHYHGSDIRGKWGLRRKYWSKADSILYSTLDLPDKETPEYAVYMPNPVDTEIFFPRSIQRKKGKLRVLIASSAWVAKGTDIAIHALSELKDKVEASIISYGVDYSQMLLLAESLNLHLNSLPKTLYQNMREYYWNSDLILDQFRCGVVGLVFLEAVACGRPVLGYISSKYPEFVELPLKDIDSSEKIVKAIEDIKDLTALWSAQYAYLKANHDVNAIVEKTFKLYKELSD